MHFKLFSAARTTLCILICSPRVPSSACWWVKVYYDPARNVNKPLFHPQTLTRSKKVGYKTKPCRVEKKNLKENASHHNEREL